MPGTDISQVEILGISKYGFWLFLDEEDELFVSFSEFSWFRKSSIEQLFHVERPLPPHLHWPELDIDLHVDSIRHPEKFPLISQTMRR